MVNEMRAPHASKESPAQEPSDSESTVNEAIVDQHVGEPEEGHPAPDADEACAQEAMQLAATDDERYGEGSVQEGEPVVLLESAGLRLMMGAMDPPEPRMPGLAMKEPRPWLHRRRRHERDDRSERELLHGDPDALSFEATA